MEKIDLKGSLTEQNLLKAFAGESQAAARYRMYAKQARKDGFEKVACFFDETVHNELRHGKIYFEFLQGGMVEITASYPAGVIGTTLRISTRPLRASTTSGRISIRPIAKSPSRKDFPRSRDSSL